MNRTSVITQPVDLRELAREWIADTITKHLHPELGGADRISNIAASIEDEVREKNMPIELAVSMAVEWCDEQNAEAGLVHFSNW
jgi:hypothetical protein